MTGRGGAEADVVVVGLGPGGEFAAQKLAEAGLEVIAVEERLVGGECPFWGCVPSKLLLRGSEVLGEARRVPGLAGKIEIAPDLGEAHARVRRATNDWTDDNHAGRLTDAGVQIVRGHARLDGPGRVVVDGTTYLARRGVILNAGTAPAELPIEGLAETPYWTNREVFSVAEAPRSLAVVGGGPIGCELAQVFARFGSQVRIIEASDRLLVQEEPESSEALRRALEDDGIEVITGAEIRSVRHDGVFHLDVDGEDVVAERLLVAAGRRSLLDDLGLETVGLDPSVDFIEIDERMRAGERLWAVGDATGKGAFTHVSLYQAAVAMRDLLGEDGPWADYRAVSRVTFTDPEVASVGLDEESARERGLAVVTGLADIRRSSRGFLHDTAEGRGVIKLVADRDREILVGASVVGPHAGEVIGLLVAAVHAEIPVPVLRAMHYAYPTFHRAIESALDDLSGER